MTSPVQSFSPAAVRGLRGLRGYARFWAVFLAVLAADQASKAWVMAHVPAGTYWDPPPIPVIDGFFYFVNVSNTGAAWSMFSQHTGMLALLGAAALGAVFFFRRNLELHKPLLQYTFGMMCGGILGNLLDRQFHGSVVDFLDVHLPHYRYPAFNVADSGITVGVVIYLIYSFRDWKPGRQPAEAGKNPPPASGVDNGVVASISPGIKSSER